jgi:hypothetical protein
VRFACEVAETVDVLDCNCSICAKTGFQHLLVRHADFSLEAGENALQSYRFGTGAAEHLFCKVCGIKSFYQPRSHPEAWSVNLRCLDQGHGLTVQIESFDGQNWEAARSKID